MRETLRKAALALCLALLDLALFYMLMVMFIVAVVGSLLLEIPEVYKRLKLCPTLK